MGSTVVMTFDKVNLSQRTNSVLVNEKDPLNTSVTFGGQVMSVSNFFMAIGYSAYQANNASIATQLNQIQAGNVTAKVASAITERLKKLSTQGLSPNEKSYSAGVVQWCLEYELEQAGLPKADALTYLKNATGETAFTAKTDTELDSMITQFVQYQQNTLTTNSVLQGQLTQSQNLNQNIISLMSSFTAGYNTVINSIVRNIG